MYSNGVGWHNGHIYRLRVFSKDRVHGSPLETYIHSNADHWHSGRVHGLAFDSQLSPHNSFVRHHKVQTLMADNNALASSPSPVIIFFIVLAFLVAG